MTSQQTFTCSRSTRETLEVDVVLMSLFFTIADFKQENVYLDSFFWLWNYIHLHNFFSNNKALLSSTLTSYINVWNSKHWNLSERSNFLLLLEYVIWETTWGYPTHLDVSDMSNLFYFHFVFTWSRAMTRLLTQIQFCQPGETVIRILRYKFKLTKS